MIYLARQRPLAKLPGDQPDYRLIAHLMRNLIEDFPLQPYDAEDYGYLGADDYGLGLVIPEAVRSL